MASQSNRPGRQKQSPPPEAPAPAVLRTPIATRHRLHVPKAAELVSQQLRRQIVRGELSEGIALPEIALMERFGVSRPTLREAVRILESEGLIRMMRGANGGAVVQLPGVEVATRYLGLILQMQGTSVAEIYRVHALIEPAAARLVAERRSAEAAAELRACLDTGQQHLDNDTLFGTDTARFRNKLIELAGIPTLSLLTAVLDDILERSWTALAAKRAHEADIKGAKKKNVRSFEKLIELIEAGDGDGAEAHWRKHTAQVEASMKTWLEATRVIDIMGD